MCCGCFSVPRSLCKRSILRERDQLSLLETKKRAFTDVLDCFCLLSAATGELCWVMFYYNFFFLKSTVGKFFESEMVLKLLSVFRTLLWAAGGVCSRGAYQRRAEGADPEAGARPEHRPSHVLPAAPRCRRVRGQQHGQHPRADQRGLCDLYR